MPTTFYFYDIETSGISSKTARIMQFAGQRTDLNLVPIGQPLVSYIKLTPDTLPDPYAVLLTKITPQMTINEGASEAEFLVEFAREADQGQTIFVGYNNVRFDDEFIRHLHYRNYYDPYEWQWKNGNSRWDLIDIVRMTRALRPTGINWPLSSEGKPTNRLEYLSAINGIDHLNAHDATADVEATIALAKLVKSKQPKLFNYLLSLRNKHKVAELIIQDQPLVYTSSHYSSQVLHTTIVDILNPSASEASALVYDLRQDPKLFINLSIEELIEIWRYNEDPDSIRLPIKTLKYNRVPAIAPLSVLDKASLKRLKLDMTIINQHAKTLRQNKKAFVAKMSKVVELMDERRSKEQTELLSSPKGVDERLYDGFISNSDKAIMAKLRATPEVIASDYVFRDERLRELMPLYIARNYPTSLTQEQAETWRQYCLNKLTKPQNSGLVDYFKQIDQFQKNAKTKEDRFILEELKLYGQSILQSFEPVDAAL